MNLVLIRTGHPPTIIIILVNWPPYFWVLGQADGGNTKPLVNFAGRAVERILTHYLEAGTPQLTQPAAEEDGLPLWETAELTPYSQEFLRRIITGKLFTPTSILTGGAIDTGCPQTDYYGRKLGRS